MSVVAFGPSNQLAITGTIVNVFIDGSGFQLEAGNGVGYFNVRVQSTTTYANNFKPALGDFVEATGSGTPNTSMSATASVMLLSLPSAPVTVVGQVTAMITGGFTATANGVNTHVYPIYSTTYTGSKPFLGEFVKVSGVGSIGTSIVAQSIAQTSSSTATSSPAPATSPTPAPPAATTAPSPVPTLTPTAAPTDAPMAAPTATPPVKATPLPTAPPTAAPTPVPTPAPVPTPSGSYAPPVTTAFMPSSWGKISAMQVFDDTNNGYVPQAAAAADGWRYSMVWGARNNIGTSWLSSNPVLQTAYYNALETDESYSSWGSVGHTLSWWNANHPDWVLYACTSANVPTSNPAYVPGLNSNIPLDIHNPAVVDYQVRLMANYAHQLGYHALAIDEATFWQADQGAGSGSFGCGIHQNGSFVRRYNGATDSNWAADVVAWVKQAHAILTTDPTIASYRLKLVVNHPADQLTSAEREFLANVDADLDETGYINYGRPVNGSPSNFLMRTNWAMYAQQHGVAVMMNANLGPLSTNSQLLDYSLATYLMGNLQGESLYTSPSKGYGTEQWHGEYQTNVGAPCGDFYGGSKIDASNPTIYYRRFANAVVVVNAGSGAGTSEVARNLPSGHTYTDVFGRAIPSPLNIPSNDGYVLRTTNGCQ